MSVLGSKLTFLNLHNSSTLDFTSESAQKIQKYLPPTYSSTELNLNDTESVYILKPFKSCNGLNLKLSRYEDIGRLSEGMGGKIVQRYIPNPYLLEKEGKTFKFDLRQWVLVISSPESVKCLIHYTCYLRICTSEYDITDFSGDKHFTNFNVSGGKEGCYMSEEDFEVYLGIKEEGGKWKKIKKDMEEAIVASIECTDVKAGKYGYEFLGYDFLVDEDFKVWLLEVNCSPGLRKQRGGVDVSEEVSCTVFVLWDPFVIDAVTNDCFFCRLKECKKTYGTLPSDHGTISPHLLPPASKYSVSLNQPPSHAQFLKGKL